MELTVPTNWDDALVERLAGLPIESFYAKLREDAVGGGRTSGRLPKVSRRRVEEHIRLIHQRKTRFCYALNGTCLGNAEYEPSRRRRIFALLDWLVEAGSDSVVVSLPFLLEWVKKNYPSLRVSVSVFAGVDSIATARMYEDLGADEITIPQDLNRDFSFLARLRRAVKLDLKLLVNTSCLYGCAFRRYHNATTSHSSQEGDSPLPLEYAALQCNRARCQSPAELVRSPWIRPEDLAVYERLGIGRFKLAGRTNTTEWIIEAAKAYAGRRSPANFARILSGPKASGAITRSPLKGLPELEWVIDNKALDGFIRRFPKRSCSRVSCEECLYCDRVAKQAVRLDPKARRRLARIYGKTLSDFALRDRR